MDILIKTPKKKALVTGANGQDGSFLSEYLLSKDYDVYGTIRRNSVAENQDIRISHLENKIQTEYADLTDISSLERVLKSIMPDEIYNTAAQSHVRISFDLPHLTIQSNSVGVLNLMESYRYICPSARLLQCSSSEMFGNTVDDDNFQRESTPMNPVSPYGISKLFSYHLIRHYRRSYKLFAVNSICFNHESSRRSTNFVTNKIVKAAVRIKLGLQDKLELGNMDSFRDFGHSKDYVRAMNMLLNHSEPLDLIISTEETHSIREFCEITFSHLGMKYGDYVVQNQKFMRPEELQYLRGSSQRLRTLLGWKPEYSFTSMILEMIQFWEDYYK